MSDLFGNHIVFPRGGSTVLVVCFSSVPKARYWTRGELGFEPRQEKTCFFGCKMMRRISTSLHTQRTLSTWLLWPAICRVLNSVVTFVPDLVRNMFSLDSTIFANIISSCANKKEVFLFLFFVVVLLLLTILVRRPSDTVRIGQDWFCI